ncbi:MAG: hypothetical protein IJL59_00045, partial [Clostridia bacterium]|nr:hypothetical protein [Clostridia bacterium]
MKHKRMLLLCVCVMLSACMPTPQNEIVVNRADGGWEAIINGSTPAATVGVYGATPVPDTQTVAPIDTPPLPMPSPAMDAIDWKDSFTVNAAMDEICVIVDAKVAYPHSGTAPVAAVGFQLPDVDRIDRLIAYFLGEGPLYTADRTKTKSYYRKTMERCTAALETETDA